MVLCSAQSQQAQTYLENTSACLSVRVSQCLPLRGGAHCDNPRRVRVDRALSLSGTEVGLCATDMQGAACSAPSLPQLVADQRDVKRTRVGEPHGGAACSSPPEVDGDREAAPEKDVWPSRTSVRGLPVVWMAGSASVGLPARQLL